MCLIFRIWKGSVINTSAEKSFALQECNLFYYVMGKKSNFPLFTAYVSHYGTETGFNERKRKTNDSLVTLYHGKYLYKALVGSDKNTKDWRFKTKWNEFHFTLPST